MRPGFIDQVGNALLLDAAGPADGNAEHTHAASYAIEAGHQAGLGAVAARGMDDPVDANAEVGRLLQDFCRATDITQCTDRVRAANGNDVRLAAGAAHLVCRALACLHHLRVARYVLQRRAEQPVEQNIAIVAIGFGRLRDALFENENALQADLGRRGCCLPGVVRLKCAQGDQRIGALAQRIGDQVFEFAGLVAAGGEARAIVALDPEARATEPVAEACHGF